MGWPGAEARVVWTIFWINLLTIAVAFKKRMILYALLNAIFLFLVTGQAFFIQGDLDRSPTTMYLLNFINEAGFNLALWYVFGVSCVFLALAAISTGYRRYSHPAPDYSFAPGRFFYVFHFALLCLISAVLILVVVGTDEFLNSSRPGFQTGSTIFLVLLSLGLMPLLFKIIYKSHIGRGDVACFLVSFAVTGAMGRISALYYLMMIFLAVYYTRGWADAPLTPKLIAKVLMFGGAAFVLFVGYGAIRGAQGFTHGSLSDLIDYVERHPENSVLSVEWNYRGDIEGMSGTAAALTQYVSEPNSVHYDYGASWLLQGAIQWVPGVLKSYASSISDLSAKLNWSPYSIVATGVESFFMSFGWGAIIAFPVAVYLLAWRLPLRLQKKRLSPAATYVSYVLLTWEMLFVRGPLTTWIAFCVSYSLIPLLFWPLFRRHFRRAESADILANT
jgi:hypothetical protein